MKSKIPHFTSPLYLKKIVGLLWGFLLFCSSGYAQFTYCSSTANSPVDGDIGMIVVNGDTTMSTCTTTGGGSSNLNQYSDYTNLGVFTTLMPGTSANFGVGIITCGGVNYQHGVGIYIDFNRNGVLTDPGEEVYVTPTANAMVMAGNTLSGSFIVPSSIVTGQTLMRIVLREAAFGANITPCGSFVWGEVEDYTVMLGSPITATTVNADCSGVGGSIDITYNGGTAPYTYLWSNGATTEDLVNVGSGGYTVFITDAMGNSVQNTFYVNSGALVANESITLPTCFTSDGAISLSPTGGAAPFQYQWNTLDTTTSLNNLSAGGYSVNITDANGCFLHQAFLIQPSANCYVKVSGKVFHDVNLNCIKDSNEITIPYSALHLTNTYNNSYAGTVAISSTGDYQIITDTGSYELTITLPSTYMLLSPCASGVTYSLPLPQYGIDTTGINFPVQIPSVQDLVVNLVDGAYVPGFNHTIHLNYRNAGTVAVPNPVLTYQYDSKLDILGTSVPYTSWDTVNHIFTWNLDTLHGLSNWEMITISAKLDTPQVIGTPITSILNIDPTTNDILPSNNTDSYIANIVAAFDPNMKEVSPVGVTEYGLVDANTTQDFHYTVHFQNTGNYFAQFVIIKDSIPEALDIQSILFEGSSHPCQITISNERELVFTFSDIFLPDSTTDEAGSKGFVSFVLKLKPNTPAFTELKNKVGIYFDFNHPVITNEVQNVLYLFPTLNLPTNVTACEANEISTTINGGKAPYDFVWSNGNADNQNMGGTSSQNAGSFGGGMQSVTVTDVYGYSISQNFNLTLLSTPDATFALTQVTTSNYLFVPTSTTNSVYLWDFGDGQTSNLTTPTHQYAASGNYVVSLTTENQCGIEEETQTINVVTSVANSTEKWVVKAYPNPVVTDLIVEFSNPQHSICQFRVTDALGRVVHETQTQQETLSVSTEKWANGTYFWTLKTENHSANGSIQK